MMEEMKFLTLEKLVWPTAHDSSTRKTMSACATVLHAELRKKKKKKSTNFYGFLFHHFVSDLIENHNLFMGINREF